MSVEGVERKETPVCTLNSSILQHSLHTRVEVGEWEVGRCWVEQVEGWEVVECMVELGVGRWEGVP